MLTKEDYKAIAEIIKMYNNSECAAGAYNIARTLVRYFSKDNPQFNENKFLKACGIKE